MQDGWKFVVCGLRSHHSFTYVGYGDHYDAIEGAIRTFFLLYPRAAEGGYRVYQLDGDNLMYLFEEKARNARTYLKMFREGKL